VSRQPPPPGIVAAAEQDYHAMRDQLDDLLTIVRALLNRDGFSEVQAVTDVWLTLLYQDPRNAAFLGAVAVVQLAKNARRLPPDRR
jgi:hypothetical protein